MSQSVKLDKQNIEDILSLTPVQEGMLFYYLNEPESELYFEQFCFRLTGNIDVKTFKAAWDFVAQSNEMLRTVFRWEKIEKPVQIVLKTFDVPVMEHDLSSVQDDYQQALLDEIRQKDRKERIDISNAAFRITLCKLSTYTYEMIVSSYHIIFDGWSNGIILKELLETYNALFYDKQPIRPLKSKYKDFIKWLDRQDDKKQGKYWKEYLQGFDRRTLMPADRKPQKSGAEARVFIDSFPTELTARIREYAKKNHMTLASVLYGIWGIILQKYNNCQDVVFGTTVSGRAPEIKGVENIVGLFINTPPLRIKASSDEYVKSFLENVESMLREREEYECTPLTKIKPYIEADSKDNLFDSIVVIENYPLDKGLKDDSSTLSIELCYIFEMTNYDITFVISTFDNIGLRFIYNAKLFDEATIKRLSSEYINTARYILEHPDSTLSDIDILSEDKKIQILFNFNNTLRPYTFDKTIFELFEQQAAKTPDHMAVLFQNQSISYKELNERANKLARMLRENGVTTETVVGIMMERSVDMIVSLLGILKAGGVYLPIDTSLPSERVLYMLEDSGASMVITSSNVLKAIPFTSLQNFASNSSIKLTVTNPRGHIKDFDGLPIPDRRLINLNLYKNKIGMASVNNCISVQTTRGCPYKCLYCHKVWSKHHVYRSAENIYNEIEYYYKNGVKNFAVIDDCFNLNIENSSRLFKLIIQNRLKLQLFFPNGLRGDILTPDYIDLMVEAGTRGINLSLETASPRLQKLLMKNLDLGKFRMVVEYITTKHSDIILEMATMHGFPTETEEEAMMTLDFIKSIKWLHFPYIHILKIFPNTEMEAFALEHGVSKKDILISKDRAFHELPETLPFPKSFTRKYQASFMNEYFLSKERLRQVLPVQMRILDESALAQKYNAYLPVTIKSVEDIIRFAEIDDFKIHLDSEQSAKKEAEEKTIFDIPATHREKVQEAKRILFLDLSQHFSTHSMLYKVAEQPIGQIYLLTYLKNVFGDKIDGRIYKSGNDFDSYDELKALVDEYKPDMIGIRTLTYFSEFFHETVSLLRQWGIDVPVITGGPYASSDYDTILKDKNVDLVIFGEGEHTLAELVWIMMEYSFTLPAADVLKTIDGIAFRDTDRFIEKDKARKVFVLDRIAGCLDLADGANLEPASMPENLAYVMYTSGSTGKPKGVMVEHRQVNNCIFWMQDEFMLSEKDIVIQRTNLTFDPSVWEIFWPLYTGACVRLITSEQARDAEFLINLMSGDSGLTMMYCPASLVTAMVYLLDNKSVKPVLKLPWLIIGAEPISVEVLRKFYSYFKGKIVNTYGPTECTINNTYFHIDMKYMGSVVPIGKPVANNQIYILSQDMQPMPVKAAGEIYIAGDSVGRGYINNSTKTSECFLENPFGKGKLYKTGDIGRWLEDGNIEIMGRRDEQIKIRGYRIEPGEIEAALLSHKTINGCTVVIRDRSKTKPDIKKCKLCGITTAYPGVSVNDDEICDLCQDFNVYKMYMDKYFGTLEDLENILKENRKVKKNKYDCVLLYSGGKGSAHALYRLVEMGYNVLTLTFDNGYLTRSDIKNIKQITGKLGVDNVILTHKNTDVILKESCKLAHTVCRGCFHTSSSLALEYACKNNINIVIGATLSRGQILENKLLMFYKQGISNVEDIQKELSHIQKSAREMDKSIFEHMDIDVIRDGTAYDAVRVIDFYRYCDITNEELLSYLNAKDEYWKTRKNYAIYSTNCPIKQIGDLMHLNDKNYHYYGSATSWENRMGHITLKNVQEDLAYHISQNAVENFSRRIGYMKEKPDENIDTKYICAYVVASGELTALELREYLSDKLPGYMIPSHFVFLDKIPLTLNGKIDKKALPAPDVSANTGIEFAAPENATEEILVELWQKVLGIERVGINDNFFDIGGNSILLIQLHAQIEKQFPGKVSMTDLFAHTTVSKLAAVLQGIGEIVKKDIAFDYINMPDSYFLGSNKSDEGSVFKFNIDNENYRELKNLSCNEGVDVIDILESVYIYLFTELTGISKATVQSTTRESNSMRPITIDRTKISGFSTLFKLVNEARGGKDDPDSYHIQDIELFSSDKSNQYIIPLFCEKRCLTTRENIGNVYDIIMEADENNDGVTFVCEFNNKRLRKESIKELVNSYMQLIGTLIQSYKV